MGIEKSVAEYKNIIELSGRINFIENADTYTILGRSDSGLDTDYNNFAFTSNGYGKRYKAMFGSKYTMTITPSNAMDDYTVDTIDGVNVSESDNMHFVSIKFSKTCSDDEPKNTIQKITVIVPVSSDLLKIYCIGDYAKIDINISVHREDYLG